MGRLDRECKECGKQFVEHPLTGPISEEKKAIIDRLLLETISLAGIARAMKVGETWLQSYVNKTYAEIPRSVEPSKKSPVDSRM